MGRRSFYSPASQGISLQQDLCERLEGNGEEGGVMKPLTHFP